MKLGKVSQTVYRRSVLKQIHIEQEGMLIQPSIEEACYGIQAGAGENVITSEVSLYGDEKDLCFFAIIQACNHLEAKGAEIKGLSVQLMLPDYAFESRIKAMFAAAYETAKELGAPILRADAQIVPGISTTIAHVTASGILKGSNNLKRKILPGQDILLLNYIGLEGTLRIKRAKEKELSKRFISSFLNRIEEYRTYLSAGKNVRIAREHGASVIQQVTEGGIMAALWNMAESSGVGLSVDMRKLSLKQETVEVCECFHLNPYQLTSAGAMIAAVENGDELAEILQREGMQAVVIGRATEGNDRVITSGGEIRYLDRPAPDELNIILGEKKKG